MSSASVPYRIKAIQEAVEAQAEDESLWFVGVSIGEAYLQQALRDLHRVIETGDADALIRILEQAKEHRK
jgi:hypothetical protein